MVLASLKGKHLSKRVVITGMGVISPIGTGIKKFCDGLIEGKNGCKPVTLFDTSKYRTNIAGEIKDFSPEDHLSKSEAKILYRGSQFAIAASRIALKDSGLDYKKIQKDRFGACMGSNTPDPHTGEEIVFLLDKNNYLLKPSTKAQISSITNKAMDALNPFGFNGPAILIPTACAAGNYCLGYAYDLIVNGRADYMFAGGADPLNQLGFAGFNRLRAFAPEKCQPFDKNRKGLIMSEGASILVLETLESALKRDVKIYAELLGYGLGSEAYHPTAPHPEGIGGIKAIKDALKYSGLKPKDIDYVNAHGTATIANDKMESRVINKVFGKRKKKIPVSSTKSMVGHMMGAASAAEAIATCLAIDSSIIPPTINFKEKDPLCDIDCVPNKARKADINIAISNSFAFGGNIATVALGKFRKDK